MERRRAFIHIGLAKTGTKSIQFAVAQRRSKLARAGWLFPKEGTSNNRSGHHGLAWHLQRASHHHPALRNFDLDSFKAAIAAAADQNVIISSEELSRLSGSEQAIRSLLALFPGHEVFVVAYVREQAELLNSLYAQLLDDLTFPGSIGGFVARAVAGDNFNYPRLFGSWRRVLGDRLIVRPFDRRDLLRGDVVQDFAGLLGIEEPLRPLPDDHKNRQPNPLQVAVLIGLSRKLAVLGERWVLYSDRHRHLRRLVSDILEDPELAVSEPYWGIGPLWVKRVREHYKESNRAFFSEIAGRDFSFSAVERLPRRNAVAYGDLEPALRARLEARLLDGLADAPEEHNRGGAEAETLVPVRGH